MHRMAVGPALAWGLLVGGAPAAGQNCQGFAAHHQAPGHSHPLPPGEFDNVELCPDWRTEVVVSPAAPALEVLYSHTYVNNLCDPTEAVADTDRELTESYSIGGTTTITAGMEAAAGALVSSVSVSASVELTFTGSLSASRTFTVGISSSTTLGACSSAKYTFEIEKRQATGTVEYAEYMARCQRRAEPGENGDIVTVWCGRRTLSCSASGFGHSQSTWEDFGQDDACLDRCDDDNDDDGDDDGGDDGGGGPGDDGGGGGDGGCIDDIIVVDQNSGPGGGFGDIIITVDDMLGEDLDPECGEFETVDSDDHVILVEVL